LRIVVVLTAVVLRVIGLAAAMRRGATPPRAAVVVGPASKLAHREEPPRLPSGRRPSATRHSRMSGRGTPPACRPIAAARACSAVAERRAWPAEDAVAMAAVVAADVDPTPRLKHDVFLLGHLGHGLGFYRFSYYDSDKTYVGVLAQEVQAVMPEAVVRGDEGYLRVYYEKLGLPFQTYDAWIASGKRLPAVAGETRH
jgi:hypothetical protein